jgi:hypothetical protein
MAPAPPVPTPAATTTTAPTVAAAPTPPEPATPDPPAPPPFDLATAHVDMGQPLNMAGGLTATTVGRALRPAAAQLTACYRAGLPKMSAPLEGATTLHVETDGTGMITDARVTGALGRVPGPCMARAVLGRSISGVDTGTASADVPLVFKAR